MEDFVKLEDITKIYKMGEVEIRAADNINFSINKGEFVVIVGPSGAGKTTVLNILGGMDTATSGTLLVDGEDITAYDSKKLTERRRYELREVIEKEALAWGIGVVSPEEIDEINILNASFLAMHRAINQLAILPEHLLIDGNRFTPYKEVSYTTIVKGDGKYLSIAAASILAKTYRDDYMKEIDKEYPVYHWKKNKGYPTVEHRAAIAQYGVSPYHRKSFNLLGDSQLSFEFV